MGTLWILHVMPGGREKVLHDNRSPGFKPHANGIHAKVADEVLHHIGCDASFRVVIATYDQQPAACLGAQPPDSPRKLVTIYYFPTGEAHRTPLLPANASRVRCALCSTSPYGSVTSSMALCSNILDCSSGNVPSCAK